MNCFWEKLIKLLVWSAWGVGVTTRFGLKYFRFVTTASKMKHGREQTQRSHVCLFYALLAEHLFIYLWVVQWELICLTLIPSELSLKTLSDFMVIMIIITIIIIFTCDWVDTRWQGSFYILHYICTAMKVDYLRVQLGRATWEACSGNLEVSGTIPALMFELYGILASCTVEDNDCSDILRGTLCLLIFVVSDSVQHFGGTCCLHRLGDWIWFRWVPKCVPV
jgi:hypothetical protein